MDLRGKKVTIVGLARSGVGAARLLSDMGADVTVTDMKTERELSAVAAALNSSVRLSLGGHPEEIFTRADMIVVSPGVPLEIKPIASAKERGIPIIGELELAYRMLQAGSRAPGGKGIPFLAVTGSNGKSTTTSLLDHMLRKGCCRTLLGGNIGNAITEEIHRLGKAGQRPDYVVAEVSSFQLEAVETFRPHIASILNITPDHLDRYHSMEEYADAKARIFMNQGPDDFIVLNADDPGVMDMSRKALEPKKDKPAICFFSRHREDSGIYARGGFVYGNSPAFRLPSSHYPLIGFDDIRIKGVHNLENAMAAAAMALLAGCPAKAVIESLREFPGLEHRLELVRVLGGVRYFNDSKGTNVGAVEKSLESFTEPLVLIAGGRDKAGDFSALRRLVSEKVRALVLIGEAAVKIRQALGDVTETVMAADLRDAVSRARQAAREGDVVLLSPACASFDMFRDFEDRGRQFKKAVLELEGGDA